MVLFAQEEAQHRLAAGPNAELRAILQLEKARGGHGWSLGCTGNAGNQRQELLGAQQSDSGYGGVCWTLILLSLGKIMAKCSCGLENFVTRKMAEA